MSIYRQIHKKEITVFFLPEIEMEFHKDDAIVISGTRFDGCFGTVINRAATNGFYRVRVTIPPSATKVVVLSSSALFPAFFPDRNLDTHAFILSLEEDDTIQLALALDIPIPLTFRHP